MTKIIAHRGASNVTPENTMAAFEKAKKMGADGVELDVHVLPDKTVVVHHDAQLGRCEYATGSIYDYRRDNIKSFSVGEKFSLRYTGETVPYLEEALEFLKENKLQLNCEIKCDTGFCFAYEEIIKLLYHHGMAEDSILSSFDHRILLDIKEKYPRIKLGMLYHQTHGMDVIDYCVQNGFHALHPHFSLVDQEFVKRAHENGLLVNVWTVDELTDIMQMKEYGVDSIITNDLETAQRY